MRKEPGSQVRPRLLYARTTWKKNSAKFAVAISGVSSPMKPPSSRVERDHPRSPPHVATNGARKRSKLLRLATGRLPENFGVLRTSPSRSSPKFAARNSHTAYKDSPYGGCAYHLMLATVVALIDKAGLTSPAPLRKEGSGSFSAKCARIMLLSMYEKLGTS